MAFLRFLRPALVFLPLAVASAFAQQYAFHEYGEDEGLNSLTANCILQDHRGFVWVGTENGLYVFDGSSFSRIGADQGLTNSFVTSIHEDASGELWVATNSGVFHGDDHHFASVAPPNQLVGNLGQQISSIDPNRILVRSRHQLVEISHDQASDPWQTYPFFSPAQQKAYPQLATIHNVFVSRSGDVWTGCGDAVCQTTGSTVHVWTTDAGVPSDTWSWFLEDSSGRLWARGSHHIRQLTPHATTFVDEDITTAPVTFTTDFVPIVEDARHRIITRTDHGLAIWTDGRWQILGAENGLRWPGILALLVDHDGGLWLGTYGKGVERWIGYGDWDTWTENQGLVGNLAWSFLRDSQGVLWAATEHGIVRLDPGADHFVPWHPDPRVPTGQVINVRQDSDQSLWFTSLQGKLLHYFPQTGKIQFSDTPTGWSRVWTDSSGRQWALGENGLLSAAKGSTEFTPVEGPNIPGQRISDVCEDPHHSLWFFSQSGLTRFAAGQWTHIDVTGKKVGDFYMSATCSADGSLWVGGASSGVSHLVVRGDSASPADPPLPADLSSIEVMFVRQDRRGWIWIGSGSGVYVFNGDRWRHVTREDGLAWQDCNEDAFFEDADGSIWIGTADGLSHLLHPQDLFRQPPLRLTAVNASLGDTPISTATFTTLAWTRAPLQVHVASSAFDQPSALVYRYRIVDQDRDWLSTRDPDIQYSSLGYGIFRFEIYAENIATGVRSPVTAFAFRIRTPWWRTTAFDFALGIFLSALGLAVIYVRERGIRARQAQLQALVLERTEQLEREKHQLLNAREALREQATHDALTGLLNHGAIHDVIASEIARTLRDKAPLAAVMIDIDHFKSINDRYGHIAGDHILREFARRIRDTVRPYDAAGRFGGEEFLLVMPHLDLAEATRRLDIIQASLCGELFNVGEHRIPVTCSIGATVFRGDSPTSVEKFLNRADKALYRAKNNGRNRIELDTVATQPEEPPTLGRALQNGSS